MKKINFSFNYFYYFIDLIFIFIFIYSQSKEFQAHLKQTIIIPLNYIFVLLLYPSKLMKASCSRNYYYQ